MPHTNDFLLSNETSQLVLASIAELTDLHAAHFGSNRGSNIRHSRAFWKEVLIGGVCIFPMVIMLELLEWRVSIMT